MTNKKNKTTHAKIFALTAALLAFASCANASDDGAASLADYEDYGQRTGLYDIDYRWDGKHSDAKKWVVQTSDGIENHGLLKAGTPGDADEFCPKYKSLSEANKKLFWIYLVSAIAELESSFKPESSYTEKFNDSSGTKVVSRGLLQLSLESAKDYNCPVKKGADLYDSDTNLDCGTRILEHWISRDKVISGKSGGQWLGAGRYWSIFRNKESKIKGWTKSIPFCK